MRRQSNTTVGGGGVLLNERSTRFGEGGEKGRRDLCDQSFHENPS